MKQKRPLTSAFEGDEAMSRTKKMLVVRRLLTAGLTGIAFWNSYEHTVRWFAQNGQEGAAYALACIPEVGVFLVIFSIALDSLSRAQKAVLGLVGLGSVSITLTANLAAAGPGFAGEAAALVAPVFAIAGFCLELLGEPVVAHVAAHEPVVSRSEPPVSRLVSPGGSLAPTGRLTLVRLEASEPVAWDRESVLSLMSREGLTTAQAVSRTGISKATINRWKMTSAA